MTPRLSICTKYYENPQMLAEQYRKWAAYPKALKDQIEIVLVDDASPVHPAKSVPRPRYLPKLSIYRVQDDTPWHQNGATNLSAFVAQGEWLLLTDMDHVVSTELLSYVLNAERLFKVSMFDRVEVDGSPTLDRRGNPKPHPNSYLMTRKFYWQVGGHDEFYCGYYGTDRLLRQRLRQRAGDIKIIPVPLIRYGRETIPDASTVGFDRKENRNKNWLNKLAAIKSRSEHADRVLTLQFSWEKVFPC